MQISHADDTAHPHDENGNPIQPSNNNAPQAEEQWVGITESVKHTFPAETPSFPLAGVVIGGLVVLAIVVVASLYATRRQTKRSSHK